jgi:hypothetical protein
MDVQSHNGTVDLDQWLKSRELGGIDGTVGVAAASNSPPARNLPSSWAVGGGHLWVFGGLSAGGLLNDLWEY